MLRQGLPLSFFQRKYSRKSASYETIIHFLASRWRFDDLVELLRTTRLTRHVFNTIVWSLCAHARSDPDTFKYCVSRVIKPVSHEVLAMLSTCRAPRPVPVDLMFHSQYDEVHARSCMDVMVRYFDYSPRDFTRCSPSDYEWLVARYRAFDAQTPDTFLALPPSLRKSVRLALWALRDTKLPKDLIRRIVRTIVMDTFLGDVSVGTVVADTVHSEVRATEQEQLRLLMLQKRHDKVYEKIAGAPPSEAFDVYYGLYRALGMTRNLLLLKLHEKLNDETCLSIRTVLDWQKNLRDMTEAQQTYMLNAMRRARMPLYEVIGTAIMDAPAAFQWRVLREGLGRLSGYGGISGSAIQWLMQWQRWTPDVTENATFYSREFLAECRVTLLCLQRAGLPHKVQLQVITRLARLHGITHQDGSYAKFHKKSKYADAIRTTRVISMDPILTRKQIVTLPSHHQSTPPIRCKNQCLECLLRQWHLCDIEKALERWRHFSTLLRQC